MRDWNWGKEQPQMTEREKDGVVWLTYPQLDECGMVQHAFSTRLGGVSTGVCSSMNLSYTRGDNPEAVTENYRRFAAAAGFPFASVVTSDQTHTTNVRQVGRADCGSGITREREFHDVDGMITDEPGVTLATFYADCVPLYFVDPVKQAIGLSHSGWRGTVGKMGNVTVGAMQRAFGSDPADILAAVGPSICQDCYEVSEDVIEQFRTSFEEKHWDELFYRKENGRYQLDLWHANALVCLEAGIRPEHLSEARLCTCCNQTLLFSHRATKGKRGNLAAFLMLKE